MTLEVTDPAMITSLTELGLESRHDWSEMTISKTFVVGENEDLDFAVRWTDELGEPYTLTSAHCQVRINAGDADDNDPVLDLSTDIGGRITIDEDQWARVLVPASVVGTLEPRRYKFDLILVRFDGRRYRPIKGEIQIEQGVTFL